MLDQMFTAENFRRIFDIENRKGLDVASRFFPQIEPHTKAAKDKVQEIRELRSKEPALKPELFAQLLNAAKDELKKLKAAKSTAVDQALEQVSLVIEKSSFKIVLEQKQGPGGKPIYCIDGSPETFFVVKQLQRNLNRIYGVKQANRHDLVCQVRDTLRGTFPFELIRTDITSFYESVDPTKLFEKLDRDRLLSPSSRRFIKQILTSYQSASGSHLGIPRGVGISAYLAELYLRSVDREIKGIAGSVIYCRYVDDIVAIFAKPPTGSSSISYKDMIIEILERHGLAHNPKKTAAIFPTTSSGVKFQYLGYRFLLTGSYCKISPSGSKIAKYRFKLKAAFKDYHQTVSFNSVKAYRTLVARVKFLTGNARLLNSKSSAVTGIYYNNSLANSTSSFGALDKLLKREIEKTKRKKLKKRLKLYGFQKGFDERRFHNFSSRELRNIVEVWKHG
ncbi:antiviral reverse transcriptase Drt3a [Roseomonas mucosa]|uniref:antiviral reverse transcriptase Drt3a n=1 Tax=Roseomonas mucosa TaxID=207340 RepID=UPI0028CD2FA0|nr:antiviral reverse transcriptase Drt3a [Roseomonas mucosa]MDT8316058.1 antiviral reverse transcriptase Drt3a [Roseomonas mucosa]MDT8362779.1 antiviral reverse transcriptase Drt3a [Roseomonas mucosa]